MYLSVSYKLISLGQFQDASDLTGWEMWTVVGSLHEDGTDSDYASCNTCIVAVPKF